MNPLALRAAIPRRDRAETLVRELCNALVSGRNTDRFLSPEFTWLGRPGIVVRVTSWTELRAIPHEVLLALDDTAEEAIFLVDLQRNGRTVTAAIAVDRTASKITRLFDPNELFTIEDLGRPTPR